MVRTGTNTDHKTVTLDDRSRITLPQHIRNRFQLNEGDNLILGFDGDEIRLRPRPSFEPIRSGRTKWDNETFLDAGAALFGGIENENPHE